ncbi:MAG: hypothetical protein JO261_08150 [Alphaproteobacteria bacterium]|nr:hypothetical protein [Alphaproteobacteria bacterium]MBV9693657.1 hypothetical protein [Alphaproteobacteria bacterium]
MPRICVIGNSHIGACKNAWDQIGKKFPRFELTFFGAITADFADLAVVDGALEPQSDKLRDFFSRSSRGKTQIAGDFDGYILWGLSYHLTIAAWVFGDCKARNCDERGFVEAMKARMSKTPSIEILGKLRAITEAPVALVHDPFVSEMKPREEANLPTDDEDARRLADIFQASAVELGTELGFKPFFQAERTLANPVQTKQRFSAGLTAAGTPDIYHANAKFSSFLLRRILRSELFRQSLQPKAPAVAAVLPAARPRHRQDLRHPVAHAPAPARSRSAA